MITDSEKTIQQLKDLKGYKTLNEIVRTETRYGFRAKKSTYKINPQGLTTIRDSNNCDDNFSNSGEINLND